MFSRPVKEPVETTKNRTDIMKTPNHNPEEFIKIGKSTDTKLYILFDVSGSQRASYDYLITHLTILANNYPNSMIFAFGMNKSEYNEYNPNGKWVTITNFLSKVNEICNRPYNKYRTAVYGEKGVFSWGTSTYQIVIAMRELALSPELKTFLFIGDGAFYVSFYERLFVDIIRTSDLSTLVSVKLLLSPHTEHKIKNNLNQEVKTTLESNPNQMEYTCHILQHEGVNLKDQKPDKGIIAPLGYFKFMNYVIHLDMIGTVMAKYFIEKLTDQIPKIIEVMKNTIKTNTNVMVGDKINAYKKMHIMLSDSNMQSFVLPDGLTVKQAYTGWLSTYKSTLMNVKDKSNITELMQSRQNDPAMQKYLVEKLIVNSVGMIVVSEKLQKWADTTEGQELITEAVRDMSGVKFIQLFQKIVHGLIWQPKNFDGYGMIVVPPNQSKTDIYASLQTFLYPLTKNQTQISGFLVQLLCMCVLTLDIEVPSILRKIAEVYMLQGTEFMYQMIGEKKEDITYIIDAKWFSYHNARMMYRFLEIYKENAFDKTSDKKEIELQESFLTKMKKIYQILRNKRAIAKIQNMFKYDETKQVPILPTLAQYPTIKDYTNIICFLCPSTWATSEQVAEAKRKNLPKRQWGNVNPVPSLPDIGRIIETYKNDKVKFEYFDQQLGTNDTRNIHSNKLIPIAMNVPLEKQLELNVLVMEMAEHSKKGLIDNELLEQRKQRIREFVKDYPISTKEEITTYTISKETICKILGLSKAQTTLCCSVSNKRELIEDCLFEEAIVQTTPEIGLFCLRCETNERQTITMTPQQMTEITKQFEQEMFLPVKKSTGTYICQCVVCKDEGKPKHNGKQNFNVLPCGHWQCVDCNLQLKQLKNYKNGDFIVPSYHKCAACRYIINETEEFPFARSVNELFQNGFDETMKYRCCSKTTPYQCLNIFPAGEIACGDGNEENLPRFCEEHRPKETMSVFKECPQCRVMTQKISGCNKIHCNNCNCYWCWHCIEEITLDNPYNHFSYQGVGCPLFDGQESDDDENY